MLLGGNGKYLANLELRGKVPLGHVISTGKIFHMNPEAKINRLSREIAAIDRFFYGVSENDEDRSLHAGMLERKRDDMVRAAVLQLHTSIEDLLNTGIICRVLNVKPGGRMSKMGSVPARAVRKMLFGAGSLGFDMKLNFAVSLGVMTTTTQKQLAELNILRNKCGHNWLLRVPVRRGRRRGQKKPPLLLYRGQDLHKVAVLEQCVGWYTAIYLKLFMKYLGSQDIRIKDTKILTPQR
jgi:hypothetical protein